MSMGLQLFELVKNDLEPFLEKLFEGGAFGHLAHPFEDLDMTFGQIKHMVDSILSGKVEAYEKIDGQQISFTWKDGKLLGARNKSQIKEFGKGALTPEQMRDFIGRNPAVPKNVINAFYLAMVDLQAALAKIAPATLQNLFQEGKRFMNTEVVAEETANVIPYYKDYLVFHGLIEYDVNGAPIRQLDGSAQQLESAVNSVGGANQSKYQIKGPNKVVLKNFQELPKEKKELYAELKKLQKSVPDTDTIQDQVADWWKTFILQAAKQIKYQIPNHVLDMLVARWGRRAKGANTIPKIVSQIDDERFKEWLMDYDKTKYEAQYDAIVKPYELFFLKLGAEVLGNASGFLSASPIKTISDLSHRIQQDAIKIKQSKDLGDVKRLKTQLEKLEKIGRNKMVSAEGIVFSMNDKLYKLTGVFAPVNQILSILTYKKPTEEKPVAKSLPKTESESTLNLLDAPANPIDNTTKTTAIKEGSMGGVFERDYASVYGKFRAEFLNHMDGEVHWKLVPASLLKNTWYTFVKYGRANKTDVMKIWDIVKDNALKIIIAGKAADYEDPEFFMVSSMTDPWAEASRNKLLGYMKYIFTFQYDRLISLLKSVYTADTPEELLYGIDRILNFTHDRGEMASYFVEGGKKTLNDIFEYKAKGIHLVGRLFEDIIKEGGNVVYTNSSLENKYLEPTIKNALQLWGVGKLQHEVVGSKHKAVMNDIDVAVGWYDIAKLVKANPEDRTDFWSKVESYFKAHKPKNIPEPAFKVNKGLDQIHISAPIVGQTGKFVQIDLMVGDVGFMKDALSGAPLESKYKAVYRNILLADILAYSHEPTKDPNVLKKYQFHSKKGIQSVNLINKAGKIEKSVPELVYNNMNDAAAFLFGPGTTFNDINTFEKLFKLIDSPSFRYKNKKAEIIDTFNKDVERLKLPPPAKE